MFGALRARRRAAQEEAILSAWWAVRIRRDVEQQKAVSLQDYLDELLSEDELLEKSSERLASWFDARIEGVTEH